MSQQKSTTTISLGGTRQVAGSASAGGSREDPVATSGNWDAEQYRAQEYANWWSQNAHMMDPWSMMYGGMGSFTDNSYIEQAASQIEAMTQVTQLGLQDLPPELLGSIAPDTLLRFAFSPEDMRALDLNGEHDAIAEVRNVLTVNNPSKELMEHLVKSGQFKDVVWSGHGSDKGLWITNAEGKAEMMPADQIAAMFKDSDVQEVLLNVCKGGAEVDDKLNDVGIDTFGYTREIDDTEAIQDASTFAQAGSLDQVAAESTGAAEGAVHNRGKDPATVAAEQAAAQAASAVLGAGGLLAGVGVGAAAGQLVKNPGLVGGEGGSAVSTPAEATVGGEGAGALGSVADQLNSTGNTYGGEGGYVDPYAYYGYGFNYSGMYAMV